MSPWYIARASGVIAYLLLTLASCAGLVMSTRFVDKKLIRKYTVSHEALAIASLAALLVHIVAIVNDEFFDFGWSSAFVPWASPYKPVWVGVGVIAFYLLVLTNLSFYVRKRIGPRLWRRLHYASPVLFATATMHGLAAGTDTQHPLGFAMYVGATVAVGALLIFRLGAPAKEKTVKKAPNHSERKGGKRSTTGAVDAPSPAADGA